MPLPLRHSRNPRHARLRPVLAATATAALVTGLASAPAYADDKPTAAVSMGDSYISGESAGDYEPGTDEPGNFCHRSAHAEIKTIGIPVDRRINLACSGATTDNVRLGGTPQNGDAPQAERLRTVARNNQVKLVVLSIGGNDVGFADLVLDCIKAYFLLSPRCQEKWSDKLPKKLAAAQPKIAASLSDIRTVMREEGYADSDYELVLQSYPSPVTGKNRYTFTKAFEGCPVRNDDARWARTSVVSQFSATMAATARKVDARFLDMQKAFYGREVCAKGITHSQEWASGITINVKEILNGLGQNLVQESLHPNRRGHAQFGNCLTAFYGMGEAAARCIRGADGNLAPQPTSTAAVLRAKRMGTVPYIHEPAPVASRKRAYAKETRLNG
ncbi:MAG: GDSL-type esterase/lipase family protein [Streptosporangiales bacterium]